MKYDLNLIESYITNGLLEVQSHPTLPLKIYNYSRECAFEKKWDEITLAMRGTVLDHEGNLIAKGFDKFFNMEELTTIPNEPFEVFEKMDGSLGILFYYQGEWILCTRGSFTSPQAIKGKEILNKKYNLGTLYTHMIYLFEIIYPENRIVVDYEGEEKLVMLAELNSTSWLENTNIIKHRFNGFHTVDSFTFTDYKQIKSMIKNNHEGFVIKFESGLRMKIKGEDYVRLHKLMTNFSNVDIWEALKAGDDVGKLLENVPDEFDEWVRNTIAELQKQYKIIEQSAKEWFIICSYPNEITELRTPNENKKDFALAVQKHASYLAPILYKMYDNKDYSGIIYRYIRPDYQKPFWQTKTDNVSSNIF